MNDKLVIVTDYTWPSTEPEASVLQKAGANLVEAETGEEEELIRLVADADGILTCFRNITAPVIDAGKKLKVIGRYGIGVDNIDIEAATRFGIPVTNVPAYCLDEVAEHAMAFLLACGRSICRYNSSIREGNWDLASGRPIYRIRGRTLGILGFGKIGQALAEKAIGFGLKIIAHDAFIDDETIRKGGAEPVSLDEVVSRSDFLSIHTPLNPDTRHLINEVRLREMKQGAFVLNAARGGIIDLNALAVALKEGWIGGAAIDVFEPEHLPNDHPLLDAPNLIATPHVAFYSEESVLDLQRLAAENVAAILSNRRPESVVNPEVLELPRWANLQV